MADVARGEQIKALRNQKSRESQEAGNGKITQPTVAEAVGVTLRAVQEWESSTEEKPKGIDREHAVALAKFLGVAPDDVSRRRDEEEASPLQEINRKLDLILHALGIDDQSVDTPEEEATQVAASLEQQLAKNERTAAAKKKPRAVPSRRS